MEKAQQLAELLLSKEKEKKQTKKSPNRKSLSGSANCGTGGACLPMISLLVSLVPEMTMTCTSINSYLNQNKQTNKNNQQEKPEPEILQELDRPGSEQSIQSRKLGAWEQCDSNVYRMTKAKALKQVSVSDKQMMIIYLN